MPFFFEGKPKTKFLAIDLPWINPPKVKTQSKYGSRCHTSWNIQTNIPVFEAHILEVIVCQIGLKKSDSVSGKALTWHSQSHSVVFSTSPMHHLKSSMSKGIKTAKLLSAYFMVNKVLKMQNIRARQAHIGAFPTIISWPQKICSSDSSRSRDVAPLSLSVVFYPPMFFQLLLEFTALYIKKFSSVF